MSERQYESSFSVTRCKRCGAVFGQDMPRVDGHEHSWSREWAVPEEDALLAEGAVASDAAIAHDRHQALRDSVEAYAESLRERAATGELITPATTLIESFAGDLDALLDRSGGSE